jgi:hypothetical protein
MVEPLTWTAGNASDSTRRCIATSTPAQIAGRHHCGRRALDTTAPPATTPGRRFLRKLQDRRIQRLDRVSYFATRRTERVLGDPGHYIGEIAVIIADISADGVALLGATSSSPGSS